MREDSKGRTVSKRKVRELLAQVDPEERLDDEVEDVRFFLFIFIFSRARSSLACSFGFLLFWVEIFVFEGGKEREGKGRDFANTC